MSNCTGVVYGAVTYGDGSPISPPQSLSAEEARGEEVRHQVFGGDAEPLKQPGDACLSGSSPIFP